MPRAYWGRSGQFGADPGGTGEPGRASRLALSAYEHGRRSPTVATFARLLSQAGWDLAAQPHVSFTQQTSARGKPIWIPDQLPRLDVARALAAVKLSLHLNWSAPGRTFNLWSRADRARVYEIVLPEGGMFCRMVIRNGDAGF